MDKNNIFCFLVFFIFFSSFFDFEKNFIIFSFSLIFDNNFSFPGFPVIEYFDFTFFLRFFPAINKNAFEKLLTMS